MKKTKSRQGVNQLTFNADLFTLFGSGSDSKIKVQDESAKVQDESVKEYPEDRKKQIDLLTEKTGEEEEAESERIIPEVGKSYSFDFTVYMGGTEIKKTPKGDCQTCRQSDYNIKGELSCLYYGLYNSCIYKKVNCKNCKRQIGWTDGHKTCLEHQESPETCNYRKPEKI